MTNFKIALIFLSFTVLNSCKSNSENEKEMETNASKTSVQVQGHRGDRGNFPENSIPAFISAVKKGVDVLELDVVISKDKKVVVSHEPYMSSLYVSTPTGDSISKADERSYNMYEMSYDSIRQFDAGSRGNRHFPNQEKIKTYKPLLSEVIDTVETFIAAEELQPVKYNIEIKSVITEYGEYQPEPEEFVELVIEIIKERGIHDKVNIQSFDPKILNVMNRNYPETEIAYLVSNGGIEENLSLLDFKPEIYSPNYRLVKDEQFVDSIKSAEMQLIPWTVNYPEDIQRMIDLKVDGIITDYPERVLDKKR
ncbi:glycerophosphoryl diester phosphodiesterase [Salinimicrobium marinum]|uniref:Glycerophosphoryl diester phosphodiesterase n=1 Tax=Salinimicrobium marinum TaxID=680283 RepID=A0A918SJJ0_9FLAO|nr:glycerophosphodiester phosphodiesterase family protein [Salinimicrobium marinum]GHA44663.1 glycerophosphoryl diester phosphodiesterase [Salinimicrobium marinum]